MNLSKKLKKICKYIRPYDKISRKPYRCESNRYCDQKIDYAGIKLCGKVVE